jgi:hypothetical protein
MEVTKGRCLCGQVTFEFSGSPLWCGHCHCDSCRRATASPFTTWIGVSRADCKFTNAAPSIYNSSPGVWRSFCAHCGSPISFESERWPDETHLYAALLEHPEDAAPQFHVHVAEKLPWITLGDDLPQYARSSS